VNSKPAVLEEVFYIAARNLRRQEIAPQARRNPLDELLHSHALPPLVPNHQSR
jgi:hypothetical protein